jgi:transitional endoplasmic reticulum ATPase
MEQDNENLERDSVLTKVNKDLRLSHVIGQPQAVSVLRRLVNQIKYTSLFEWWGLEKPKALALVGEPGTGKTFSIRALANEVDCPLMELKYEDIASHLYDESIKRLAAFKEQAAEIAEFYGHIIILIDEGDVFFQDRSNGNVHASDVKKTTFFLRWLDGDLEGTQDITLVVTSNNWDLVDAAIRRPGRFLKVEYKKLTKEDVVDVLKTHIDLYEKKVGHALFKEFEIDQLDASVGEISGADVKSILDRVLEQKALEQLEMILSDKKLAELPIEEAVKQIEKPLISASELAIGIDKFIDERLDGEERKVGF